jgi:hypothetical protein
MTAGTEVLAPEFTKAQARKAVDKAKVHVTALWDALVELRERRAHHALGYKTWEAFCSAEFDIDKRRADQLAAAGAVRRELGTIVPTLPTRESVARELVRFTGDSTALTEIWERALSISDDPTAAQVKSVVKSWTNMHGQPDEPEFTAPRPTKRFDLIDALEVLIAKIQADNPKRTTGAALREIIAGAEELLTKPVTPGL